VIVEHALQLEGFFHLELLRGGRVVRELACRNLITNAGMNGLGTIGIGTLCNHLAVGTGSVPPAFADITLGSEAARTTDNGGWADTAGVVTSTPGSEYAWFRRTREFSESQANGNLTELGFFDQASAGILFNRQLIIDELGVPTTITKTSVERLRVHYEFRLYLPPVSSVARTLLGSAGGTSHTVTQHRMVDSAWTNVVLTFWGGRHVTNYDGSTAHNFAGESNVARETTVGPTLVTLAGYTNGDFYRDATLRFGTDRANFATGIGNVSYLSVSPGGAVGMYYLLFSPKVPKTVMHTFEVVVRNRWARR
jgi:hypothetical protein